MRRKRTRDSHMMLARDVLNKDSSIGAYRVGQYGVTPMCICKTCENIRAEHEENSENVADEDYSESTEEELAGKLIDMLKSIPTIIAEPSTEKGS